MLAGKYLTRICEGLEFKRIAGRVEQKHGCLFADFAMETDTGFNHERDTCFLQPSGQRFPLRHIKDKTKVRYRYVMAIDSIVGILKAAFGREVRNDLMPEQIEVDPAVTGSSFRAFKQTAIEHACLFQVMYRKGEVEARIAGGHAGGQVLLFSKHPFHDVEFITHIEVAVLQRASNVQANQEQQAKGK